MWPSVLWTGCKMIGDYSLCNAIRYSMCSMQMGDVKYPFCVQQRHKWQTGVKSLTDRTWSSGPQLQPVSQTYWRRKSGRDIQRDRKDWETDRGERGRETATEKEKRRETHTHLQENRINQVMKFVQLKIHRVKTSSVTCFNQPQGPKQTRSKTWGGLTGPFEFTVLSHTPGEKACLQCRCEVCDLR